MAYIINSLKKMNLKNQKNFSKNSIFSKDDKILIFIIILSTVVIAVDYALIIKFIDILKNI